MLSGDPKPGLSMSTPRIIPVSMFLSTCFSRDRITGRGCLREQLSGSDGGLKTGERSAPKLLPLAVYDASTSPSHPTRAAE